MSGNSMPKKWSCPSCGAQATESDLFCGGCGALISSHSATAAPTVAAPVPATAVVAAPAPPARRRASPAMAAVIALIALLSLSAVAFLAFRGRGDAGGRPAGAGGEPSPVVRAGADSTGTPPTSGGSDAVIEASVTTVTTVLAATVPAATVPSTAPATVPATSVPRIVVRLDPALVQVLATSALPSEPGCGGRCTYEAANVLDGDPATAWAEDVAGLGIGERLAFSFPRPVDLVGLTIRSGWQRPGRTCLYQKNGRPAAITLLLSDGTQQQHRLADVQGDQSVIVGALTSSVVIVIDGVYAGTTCDGARPEDDTLVSDIMFDVRQ